jgi:Lar family restriction alleviation protein
MKPIITQPYGYGGPVYLPCPFCGEKNCLEMDRTEKNDQQSKWGWHVRCEACGARGPCLIPDGTFSAEKVRQAWNRRGGKRSEV